MSKPGKTLFWFFWVFGEEYIPKISEFLGCFEGVNQSLKSSNNVNLREQHSSLGSSEFTTVVHLCIDNLRLVS